MRTDPKNHDYVCEHGASRNYEPFRDIAHAETILRAKRDLESQEDALKKLEHKTYDSKREMAVLDALEEVRQLNKRRHKESFNPDRLLLDIMSKYDAND